MKKRCFKLSLVAFALFISAFFMSACKSITPKVVFNESQFVMGTNHELSLENFVSLENISIGNVKFSSSNPNIVAVSPRQTLISGEAEGSAIITANGFEGFVEITVSGSSLSFSSPSNLHFNQDTGCLEWDNVYVGKFVANQYKLTIIKNSEPPQEIIVNTNSFKLNEVGNFKVKVACMARSGINESEPSNEFLFSKLEAPGNLKYNSNNNVLSWDKNGNNQFVVKKDGVVSNIIENNFITLDLSEEKVHTISVLSISEERNAFGSQSETLTLTRLKTPQISIKNNTIEWVDEQTGVSSYVLSLYKVTDSSETFVKSQTIPHNGTNYSYSFGGLDFGTYNVKVYACGDNVETFNQNNHYLNSAVSSTGEITKLKEQTIVFDKELKQISVVDFSANQSLVLIVKHGENQPEEIDISQNGKHVYNFTESGDYSFTVVNKAKNNTEIDSNSSNQIIVKQLPKLSNLQQSTTLSGKYALSGIRLLDGATSYKVEKFFGNSKIELNQLSNGEFGFVNELFGQAGNYEIVVSLFGSDSENKYVLSSQSCLNVKKLNKVILSNNESNKQITWQNSETLNNLQYLCVLSGQSEKTETTSNLYFDYSNLAAGQYNLTVATRLESLEDVLYIDSDNSEQITFEIEKQITSPQLSITKKQGKHFLVVTPSENANLYTISVNNIQIESKNHNSLENIEIDIDSILAQAGTGENNLTYNFEVYAENTDNAYNTKSEVATIKAQKIVAPTTFSVSATEEISTTKPESFINFEVLIDEEKTNKISDVENKSEYQIKIKYVSDMQNHNETFYIDSDYSMFKLTRMPIQIEQNGLVFASKAEETTQTHTSIAKITQNLPYSNIIISSCEQVGFETEFQQNSLYDFENGFKLSFRHEFVIDNAEIDGTYKNGVFASANNSYYISGESSYVTIKLANQQLNTQIVEADNKLQVSWEDKENASYSFDSMFIKNETKSNQTHTSGHNSAEVDLTDSDLLQGSLVMAISETISNQKTIYLAYVKRTNSVNVNVLEDESISATTPEHAQKVLITQNGSEISSLSEIGTLEATIDVQTIANNNNSYFFYLNSIKKSYTFKRLDLVDGIKVENDKLTWNLGTEDANFVYVLKFSDSTGKTILVELDKTVNMVDLTESKYQQILNSLGGNAKYVAIKKLIKQSFIANTEQTNKLSSDYSSNVELVQIATPTNVSLNVDQNNLKQNVIEISWTISNASTVSISNYVIEISHNGETKNISTSGTYTVLEDDEQFKNSGMWGVRVKAVGSNSSISSNFSEKLQVERLNATTVSVDKNGTISWNKINNANGYLVECSFVTLTGETKEFKADVDANSTSSNLLKEQMETAFFGNVTINIYAKGDGINTLSSFANSTIERLQSPNYSVKNDSIVINNFEDYPENTKFFATCTIDGHVVINKQIQIEKNTDNQYYWSLPTEFLYLDENGTTQKIDLSEQKTLNMSIYALNDKNINSNIATKTATVLSPLTNLRFVRDENSVIRFKATNNNTNCTNVKLMVGNYLVDSLNGNIDFAITDDILKEYFASNWQIKIQAIGDESGEYVNSKAEIISGTKLNKTQNIKTKNGLVVWDNVQNSTSYSFKMDELAWETNIRECTKSLKKEEISAGAHTISVRAVGNVGTQEKTSDIVLDGDVSANVTITKLQEVTDFGVINGYFTFETTIEKASEFVIEAYLDKECENLVATYVLNKLDNNKIGFESNGNTYYSCSDLNNKLSQNGYSTLYIKSFAKTNETNYVYSNYAKNSGLISVIKVENLNNQTAISLSHPLLETSSVDYLTTNASWGTNTNSNNGFVLNVDGNLQYTIETSYCLDKNKEWNAGSHAISYMQLGSNLNSDGTTYLTYKFSAETKITKLEPVKVYVKVRDVGGVSEPYVVFDAVSGANLYYSYLSDDFYASHNNPSMVISMASLNSNTTYNSFGMIAVNTSNVNILASTINYITKTNSENNVVNVKLEKEQKATTPTLSNGSFYWTISTSNWKSIMISEEKLTSLFTKQIKIAFSLKDSPSIKYQYVDNVSNYILLSNSQKQELINYFAGISGIIGLSKQEIESAIELLQFNLLGGFASINYGFNKFASDLPVGEYNISISLVGSGVVEVDNNYIAKFSSDYVELPQTIYVAPATEIMAVASEGNYSIKFNNINVNSTYITSAPTYILVGRKLNKTYNTMEDVNLAEVAATNLNSSEELTFNVTDLISSGKLTSDYAELYVIVKGNNKTLNGKTSNIINIKILDTVVANAEHGEITWKKVENATQYAITYTLSGGQPSTKTITNSDSDSYKWDGSELETNKNYTVSIQAQGYINKKVKNSEVFTMSGKLLEIGTVCRLLPVADVSINNGIFEWSEISNATSYEIYASGVLLEEITTLQFETTVKDKNVYNYTIKTIGTESGLLNGESTTYLNSSLSEETKAQRVNDISSISFANGLISFVPSQTTNYYKLTFYKLANGKRSDSDSVVVYTTTTTYDTNTNDSLKVYGDYDLDIQSCYQNKTQVAGTTDTFYVISQATSATYYKFEKVTNISVFNGKITWNFENSDNKLDADFEFKLMFTSTSNNTTEKTVASSQKDENGNYYYENVVFDNIETTDSISLIIYVVPTLNANNYVKSVASDEYSGIHQYAKIDSTKITMQFNDDGQLLIGWSDGVSIPDGVTGFTYEYKFELNGEQQIGKSDKPELILESGLDFNDSLSDVITLQIRVIPTIENYISSVWSDIKEISKPKAVSNLVYNTEKAIFTWDQFETENNSSYKYKIIDEVTYKNASGLDITETFIIFAEISDEKFTPFVVGTHNLSVYVMVSNSDTDKFISVASKVNNASFKLFASGNGTQDNPYVIETKEHFKNIASRANVDKKLYSILKLEQTIDKNEQTITTYNAINMFNGLSGYNFKQINDLEIDNSHVVVVDSNTGFNGVFNGNYKTLTFKYAYKTNDDLSISLFNNIGSSGKLENIKLKFEISTDSNGFDNVAAYLNVLCNTNNGIINNVLVGDVNDQINITTSRTALYLSFIAYQNNGTISNVVNNYNVTIEETSINDSKVLEYASVAIQNNGKVECAKNNGNINVTGTFIHVGGLVVQNMDTTNGQIIGSGNSGDFVITYNNNPNSSSNIGGIVADNKCKLDYCYCTSSFELYFKTNIGGVISAYIGGLIGSSTGNNITNSYTNVTFNEQTNCSVYHVVGNLTNVTANFDSVFYNNNGSSLAAANNGSFENYTNDNLSDVKNKLVSENINSTYFNNSLTLKFEDEFDKNWKNNSNN